MCGAFGFSAVNIAKERYNLSSSPKLTPMYNIRPSMKALIVTKNSPNKGTYERFGISAPWNPDQLLINAKSETVMEKKTFSKMFRESRCIVPANLWYEWAKTAEGKQPYCFKLATGQSFSFAGLYNDTGFVILTTKPNDVSRPIHNRQPLVLNDPEEEELWLNPDTEEDHLLEIMDVFPAGILEAYKVGKLVNSASNQGEELIKPLE